MVKKVMKEGNGSSLWCSCSGRDMLFWGGAVFFGALGFALVVEGLFGQFNIGFRAGFVSYLLGFTFLALAKHLKWQACKSMCR